MLKVSDVANRLNCSLATVYQLVESKRLPHYRCPGIRVSEAQLAEFFGCGAGRRSVLNQLDSPFACRSSTSNCRVKTTILPRHLSGRLVFLSCR